MVNDMAFNPVNQPRCMLANCVAGRELAYEVERRAVRFNPGADDILFHAGDAPDWVFYVRSGDVALTVHAGRAPILHLYAGTGSLLGLPAIIGNKPYSMTAIASSDGEIYRLSRDEFNEMIGQQSALSFEVLRILANEVRTGRDALVALSG